MQTLKSIAELDEKIRECDRAGQVSDDKLREVFTTFDMDPPADMPADPFSATYRDRQMRLYHAIAGREYSLANEATEFDVEASARRPFPYATQSCATAGEHLMAIGFLLRCMALPPRSRVLEFGFGWGNSTLALAALGHRVTAVDIEPRFCELLRRRAEREDVDIEIVNADFTWAAGIDEPFDAVVFFESFHHSDDHLALLDALRRAVTPQGRVFFAAEPIQTEFSQPWGLRLDGQSLWSIRKHGWLELGFTDRYFIEALARNGWFARRHPALNPPWLNVWEACSRNSVAFHYSAADPALQTQVGERVGDVIALRDTAQGTGMFGPYIALPAHDYLARLHFRAGLPRRGRAVMDISAEGGERPLVQCMVDLAALDNLRPVAELPFVADRDLNGVEVRLFCDQGCTADIEAVEIRPAPRAGVAERRFAPTGEVARG
ncbi:MAG TPA: class I SAM-dependent methyltransferase [Stellaceae bacterium]|jgi:2-polyprenyl-3-methyl-5-hydroxy-6-metoxy-1,4-benzoquinol methylase|nr:class I SAM-dependent methyltransferase [Stellaceae bacterium]